MQILFEDHDLLALAKPSGLPSQPLPSRPLELTMVRFALEHAPEIAFSGLKTEEGGLLHRLDQGTSGVLLFAKNQATFTTVRALWKTSAVMKTYRAIVMGAPEFHTLPHLIDVPLGHSAKSAKRMLPVSEAKDLRRIRGKPLPARTWVKSVRALAPGFSDLEIEIETGVMHQIRAHTKWFGCPIRGDDRYGIDSHERLHLHAWKLRLALAERAVEITAPLPPEWSAE